MDIREAEKIFKSWQEFIEVADKFFKIMIPIPESFLPYPIKKTEEALNIIAKRYFEEGDSETSKVIQGTMLLYLGRCKKDKEALKEIKDRLNMIFENTELKKELLDNLKNAQISWMKTRAMDN